MRTTLISTLLFAGILFVVNQSFAAPGGNSEAAEAHTVSKAGGVTLSGHVIQIPQGPPAHRFAPDSILVRFSQRASLNDKAVGRQLLRGKKLRAYSLVPGLEHLRIGIPGLEVEEAVRILEQLPFVEYAQPNYVISINQTLPDDPNFEEQWALNNEQQSSMYGIWGAGKYDADIDAPEAWDTITASDSLTAIIDTGIAYDHPDLDGNMWTNPGEIPNNNIDDDGNGYVDDIHGWDFANNDNIPYDGHGHGSHVAGIVAAEGNNGVSVPVFGMGTSGVLWQGQLMALKAINDAGQGLLSDAMAALQYAVDMGARISNNSWGYSDPNEVGHQALHDAIDAARANEHLFVAAAGNDAVDTDTTAHYPSSFDLDNIISVAATDNNDNLAIFSNYGVLSVDLAAPGTDVFSTWKWTYGYPDYAWLSGTSMAAPHVTGVVAMVAEQHPDWSYAQIRDRLFTTVRPLTGLIGKTVTEGIVNAANAVAVTGNPPIADFSFVASDLTVTFTDLSYDSDGALEGWYWSFGDGESSRVENPVYTYAEPGSYTVILTVTDNDGATGTSSQSVTVTELANVPPVASFTYSCVDLRCSFDGSASTDSDGSIAAYHWNFGDGYSANLLTPESEHSYDPAGTYSVTLTVTDNLGATGEMDQEVTVTDDLVQINAPANLSAVANGSAVTLSWDDTSIGEAGFEIERAQRVRGKYSFVLIKTTGGDESSYPDTVDDPGTYKYRVRAYVGDTFSDYSNEALVKVEEAPATCSDEICNDGLDNDCDGLTDCTDPDCVNDDFCSSCLSKGDLCTSDADCCSGDCRGIKCK